MNKIDYVTPHPPSSTVPVPSYQEATQAQLTIQQTPTPEQVQAQQVLERIKGRGVAEKRITNLLKKEYLTQNDITELTHLCKQVTTDFVQAHGFSYLTSLAILYCYLDKESPDNQNDILTCMEELINKGAPIKSGDSTLIHEIMNQISSFSNCTRKVNDELSTRLIQFLLQHGLTGLEGKIDQTALVYPHDSVQPLITSLLYSLKPDPNNKEKLTYALFKAKNNVVIERLLQLGADINLVLPHFKESAFEYLIDKRDCSTKTVRLCLKYGGDIHYGGRYRTPFNRALGKSLALALPMVEARKVTSKMKYDIVYEYLLNSDLWVDMFKNFEALTGKLPIKQVIEEHTCFVDDYKILRSCKPQDIFTSAIAKMKMIDGFSLMVPTKICQLIIHHRISPQFFAQHITKWRNYLNVNFNIKPPYNTNAKATKKSIKIAKEILCAAEYEKKEGVWSRSIIIPASYIEQFGQTIIKNFLQRLSEDTNENRKNELMQILAKCIHIKENNRNTLYTIIENINENSFSLYLPLITHCLQKGIKPLDGLITETPLVKACESIQKKQLIPNMLDYIPEQDLDTEKLSYVLYALKGPTPVDIWSRLRYKDDIYLAERLINRGADLNMQFGDAQETVLHKVIREYDGSNATNKYIEFLLKAGARADIMNKDKVTPRILSLLNEQILTRILKYHRVKMHQDEKNALIDYHLATQQEKIEQYLQQLNAFGEVSFESVLERKEGLCYKSKKMGWLVWLIANRGIALTKIKKELEQQPDDIKEFYLNELAREKIYE